MEDDEEDAALDFDSLDDDEDEDSEADSEAAGNSDVSE